MSWMWRTFLKGLVAVLPIALTVFVIYWLGASVESLLRAVSRVFLPARWELPGVGLVLGVLVVFGMGILMDLWVTRRLLAAIEQMVLQIPVVKSIYGAVRDFTAYFSQASKEQSNSQVVMVDVGQGARVLGFVTRSDCSGLPAGIGGAACVAVYFPMSYQIGGYTLYMPRDKLEPVDMPVEDAMRLTLTAGVSTTTPRHDAQPRPQVPV